jgi:hypothetical protein
MKDEHATERDQEGRGSAAGWAPNRPARVFDPIDEAAAKLGLSAEALRARCRRGQVREGRDVRCYLGSGVVAVKFGRTWRVRFPEP